MIPARYAASRFPGKLMQKLGDKTVIRRVYEAVCQTGLFDDVVIVTDSDIIEEEINTINGHVERSKREHESGSDRIAEVAANLDVDIIVNVQGDEPFIQKQPLEKLVRLFEDHSVQVGSLMREITSEEELGASSSVKVVVNNKNDSLYFSRSIIPFIASPVKTAHYLHIGVYAFRKETLMRFTTWPASALERAEKLEQLRYLENGVPIRMALVDFKSVAIDTPEDLEKAKTFL